MLLNFMMNEETIFTAVAETVPRVGEIVLYDFTTQDRELWNDDALTEGDAVSNKEFVVTKVTHEFRKMRIASSDHHCIWIEVSNAEITGGEF